MFGVITLTYLSFHVHFLFFISPEKFHFGGLGPFCRSTSHVEGRARGYLSILPAYFFIYSTYFLTSDLGKFRGPSLQRGRVRVVIYYMLWDLEKFWILSHNYIGCGIYRVLGTWKNSELPLIKRPCASCKHMLRDLGKFRAPALQRARPRLERHET